MRFCKDIANFLLYELSECLTIPIKNHSINLWETFMLIYMQKINFITHFFFKILQRNNLLFWVIWRGLVTHTQNDSINLKKPLMLICRQKVHFILHNFLEILQKYCKLVYFGYFGLHTHKVRLPTCREHLCLSADKK